MILGKTDVNVSKVVVGCMRIQGFSEKEAESFVHEALELDVNHFDHADIYGGGKCEEIFGEVLQNNKGLRENMFIQSKCGIVPGIMYDNSKEYILKSVDGILKRLQTEYIDMLLLHRPDALMEPEEIAEAFETLKTSGKVRYFGVSNFKPMQMELISKYSNEEIQANQMQLSITNSNMIRQGIEVNMETEGAVDRDESVLDYCRLHDITLQAWSPFQYGFFSGVFLGNPKFEKLNQVLDEIAEKYNVSTTTLAAAWILRHPAKMQVISGTTKLSRLQEICKAAEVPLTKEEWYRIYLAAGHILP